MGFLNILGVLGSIFSIGKGSSRVDLRTDSGVLQGRNNGGSWQNILGQGGSTNLTVTPISNQDYTILTSDALILGTTGNTDRTYTLPTAVGNTGKQFTVKKIDSGTGKITLDGNGTETIDGNLTVDITARYGFLTVVSDGTNWVIINSTLWA